VTAADVYCEGMAEITPKDIAYAKELRFVIKLLAIARDRAPTSKSGSTPR
jgi:homoserine dehydrogenase